MIIDTSYFQGGELAIPQVTETSVSNVVNDFIKRHEPEFLELVLGYEISKNISSYSLILNGTEFTYGGQLRKWKGLKIDAGGGKFNSIIANYVYCKYMRYIMSYSTGSGEKVIEQATSLSVSPVQKIKIAWDEMASQLNVLCAYLMSDRTTYPNYYLSLTKKSLLRSFNPLF